MPTDLFNQVSLEVQTHLTHHSETSGHFNRFTSREVAEMLFCVFEALKDMKVEEITLEGRQTGIGLVSVFVWLLPNDAEIILRRYGLLGAADCCLKATLNLGTTVAGTSRTGIGRLLE